MADLKYLSRDYIEGEARDFFEQDFSYLTRGSEKYNNYFGAYRHAYGSAVLTREFGDSFANTLGDANEIDLFGFRDNPAREKKPRFVE